MAMPNKKYTPVQIQSRINGLVVGLPAEARGVLNRYRTQGGNELVFVQNGAKFVEPEKVTIGGSADVEPSSDLA